MPIDPLVKIEYALIHNNIRQTGFAANLNLRITRMKDDLIYDWSDGQFRDSGSVVTPDQPAAGEDPTGVYFWLLGTGPVPNEVFPDVFLDAEYRFDVNEGTLPHAHTWGTWIRTRRIPDLLVAQLAENDRFLSEGGVGNYVVKEDDGVNDLLVHSVRDKSGDPVILPPGVPAQEIDS